MKTFEQRWSKQQVNIFLDNISNKFYILHELMLFILEKIITFNNNSREIIF